MVEIIMDYAANGQTTTCTNPTVFKAESSGYERWRAHAAELGRGGEWRAWSEDELCAQRDVDQDTEMTPAPRAWCDLDR